MDIRSKEHARGRINSAAGTSDVLQIIATLLQYLMEPTMSDSEVHQMIVDAVAAAIVEKEGGVPLTMAAAYDIAQTISLGYHRGAKAWDDEKVLSRVALSDLTDKPFDGVVRQ